MVWYELLSHTERLCGPAMLLCILTSFVTFPYCSVYEDMRRGFFQPSLLGIVMFFFDVWLVFISVTVTNVASILPLAYRGPRDKSVTSAYPGMAFLFFMLCTFHFWTCASVSTTAYFASYCPPNYKMDDLTECPCIFLNAY